MKKPAIHVFNARGESILATRALEDRIRELETENERLKRMLAAIRIRAETANDDQLPEPPKH